MNSVNSIVKIAVVILMSMAALSNAAAKNKVAGPTVRFDHLNGQSQSQAISAKPGQVITIIIENTCPGDFKYVLGGIPLQASSQPAMAGSGCTPVSHTLTQIHDVQFGGYFIEISQKDPKATIKVTTSGGLKDLKEMTFLISVATSQWDIGFAGGFTVSDLTNPVFASEDDGMMQNIVARDAGAEDEVSLGLAGMIHLYHHKNPQWAATFGLSTGSTNEVAYMVGPSYRFSDKAAFTLGYMWAPVDRLPGGLSIGDPLQDPNSLSNLQTKLEGGVFLSFSYSFITGIKDIFEKPFKGSGSPSVDGASAVANQQNGGALPPVVPANPPAGGAVAPCTDTDAAGVDFDGDGVTADTDPDDCDAGTK